MAVSSGNHEVGAGLCLQVLEEDSVLGWALTFLVLALLAGFLGFFGLAGMAAAVAKALLFAFVILFLVSAISRAMRRRAPPI